ncbi:hAD-superfamily hydrolase [Mycobacterium xenopi 3993]|nr:hAD-superfamily hydrolase [Mycobacterium xenopi 3993]
MLFDVDGTLVDSNFHHAVTWHRAFLDVGQDVACWRIHGLVGRPARNWSAFCSVMSWLTLAVTKPSACTAAISASLSRCCAPCRVPGLARGDRIAGMAHGVGLVSVGPDVGIAAPGARRRRPGV